MERHRRSRLAGSSPRSAAALVLVAVVAACGGGSAAGGGGGGGGEDEVIARSQALFGTSMISGSFESGRLTITLVRGASSGMAKLFLCPQILDLVKGAGIDPPQVTIVEDGTGKELATEASCG